MKMKLTNLFRLCAVSASLVAAVFGQQVTMDALRVNTSDLIPELVRLKKEEPDLKPDAFAKRANKLMQVSGFPFTFSFSDTTCDAIARSLKNSKLPVDEQTLKIKLQPLSGPVTSLEIPPADFDSGECSKCSVTLPVLEATDTTFITIVMDQHIGFQRPGGFELSKIALVSGQERQRIEREWRVPFRTKPVGLSFDGRIIYLPFTEPELSDLALAVFSEGVFEIVQRSEAGAAGKSGGGSAGFGYIEFDGQDKKFVIRYTSDCKN